MKNINQRIWDSIAKDIYDEEKMPEKINKMESQELADEAYYKVNDVALKLQEVKPYIKEGTEADKLYTNITIELNSLQMSLYKEKLNESTYRDKAGKDGIQSYFDMVYGQEPDSEYAKLILLYMKNHDEIRDDIEKIRSTYKDDTDNPEYRKAMQDIQNRDMDNTKLLSKAARIPEDERGKLYQEYLEIDKANNDEFAKQRGFNSYDEYEKHIFEAISNSKELYNAQEKLKRSEAWLKDNPDDKEVKQNIENIQNDIDDYKGIKRYSPNVEETSFKQGDEEFTVHTYNYGDDSFSISYKMHGKRNITNEPYTIDGEYNFIYDEENKEVLTGMKKDGKVVPDNWGKMTNVSKDRWLEMIHNPKDALIPWVQGSYLD